MYVFLAQSKHTFFFTFFTFKFAPPIQMHFKINIWVERFATYVTFCISRMIFSWAYLKHWRKICSIVAEIFHFNILRLSFIVSCLHFKLFYYGLVFKIKFKIWGRSNQCLLRYSSFDILRSSSIGSHLSLEVIFISSFLTFGFIPYTYV